MKRFGLILFSFLASPLAKADVATQYWEVGSGIWLMYVADGTLYRTDCDEDRLIYNRATCPTRVGSADFARFADGLRAHFAAPLGGLEQQVADIHARVQELDLELLVILNSEPDPVDPTLKDQIAVKEGEVADAAGALIPLQDQIARIVDALRTRENPDLRRQLIALQGELDKAKVKHEGLQVELAELRGRFIEANSGLFDQERYRALQNERRIRVNQLEQRRNDLDYTMECLIHVSRILSEILSGSFTTNYIYGGQPLGRVRFVLQAFKEVMEGG